MGIYRNMDWVVNLLMRHRMHKAPVAENPVERKSTHICITDYFWM